MPQIFPRGANSVARVSILVIVLFPVTVLGAVMVVQRSPYATGVGTARPQPVPFSHKHHVGDAGLDCRYCHTSVEDSPFAGVPATDICMNCHRQLWNESSMLEPVRESYRTGQPIVWNRVHDLPDFVYFNHGIHVNKGVGCETCHGRVDRMPLMWRVNSLEMSWCLDCHRNPERHLRPREEVFTMGYRPPIDQAELGARLAKAYNVQHKTDCTTCHR